MMFVLLCRKNPGWCGSWWKFGYQEWQVRENHEKDCHGRR